MADAPNPTPGPPPVAPALSVDRVALRYGRRRPWVLGGVSFIAAPGAVTALLGPSGSGKSSLLRIIAGLLAPTSGAVRLGDRSLGAGGGPESGAVSMAFQDLVVYPHLTVRESVRIAAEAGGLRRAAAKDRAAEALAGAGLDAAAAERQAGDCSGGERQRLAFARMLARRAPICLLDEPVAHLDPASRLVIRPLIRRLAATGSIVLLVTHDPDEAARNADDLQVLVPGDASDGSPATVVGQCGAPAAVLGAPASLAVADAVGRDPMNWLPVTVQAGRGGADGAAAAPAGWRGAGLPPVQPIALAPGEPTAMPVALAFRPSDVRPARPDDDASSMVFVHATAPRVVRLPGGAEVVDEAPGDPVAAVHAPPRPLRMRLTEDAAARVLASDPPTRWCVPRAACHWAAADGALHRVGAPSDRPLSPR